MARQAIAHGAADEVLPLAAIAPALMRRLRGAGTGPVQLPTTQAADS
jgi:chemotaxis response regulator CheB